MRAALSTAKVIFLEHTLRDFFRRAGREHLPWRAPHAGAYEIWVSEIMLQQTQVSRVLGYYERFLKRFPTVLSLAKATWEEFLPYYQGLGYYARGRNMLKTAQRVAEEYRGKFPREVDQLVTLPGVGPYTAAAIASFAYGKNTLAWDTNVRRVMGRFFFGSKRADIPQEKLAALLSMKASVLNAAMMDFGSAICSSRPRCGICPLASQCVYFKQKGRGENKNETSGVFQEKHVEGAVPTERRQPPAFWRDARVLLFLHENHKIYYSSRKRKFSPFIIPPSHNTRAGIKEWFRAHYGLELSVRPPYKKEIQDGFPTLFINAQVLSGTPSFPTFQKKSL